MTADALGALREATRDVHERLETELRLVDAPLTAARYTAVLERFLGFYEPFEAVLDRAGASAVLGDWPARRKAGWLEADLRDLGLTHHGIAALPRCPGVPEPATPAAVLGCLYVVEGATLGGAVIARRLREASRLPHRFFRNYGSERGVRWRRFRQAVEATTTAGGDRSVQDAVAAARATFACFYDWCAARPVERATA